MSLLCCPGIGRRVSQTSSRGRPSAMPSPAQGQWKKVGLLQQVPGVAAATYILTITATYQGSIVLVYYIHSLKEGLQSAEAPPRIGCKLSAHLRL